MRGKPLHGLWPMAVLLAAMIGAVALATARRGDGDKAQAQGIRPPASDKLGPLDRATVRD